MKKPANSTMYSIGHIVNRVLIDEGIEFGQFFIENLAFGLMFYIQCPYFPNRKYHKCKGFSTKKEGFGLLSQLNVRQNLSATGRNFGFTCHKFFRSVQKCACSSKDHHKCLPSHKTTSGRRTLWQESRKLTVGDI